VDSLASNSNIPSSDIERPFTESPNRFGWFYFLVGAVVTFLLIYLGLARPAARELALIRRQVSALEQSIWEVAGHQDTAKETTTLLCALIDQRQSVTEARRALAEMQQLQSQLIATKESATEALDVMRLLADQDEMATHARKSLAEINQLHTELADARPIAQQSAKLVQAVAEQRRWTDKAGQSLARLNGFQTELMSMTQGLSTAMSAARDSRDCVTRCWKMPTRPRRRRSRSDSGVSFMRNWQIRRPPPPKRVASVRSYWHWKRTSSALRQS